MHGSDMLAHLPSVDNSCCCHAPPDQTGFRSVDSKPCGLPGLHNISHRDPARILVPSHCSSKLALLPLYYSVDGVLRSSATGDPVSDSLIRSLGVHGAWWAFGV